MSRVQINWDHAGDGAASIAISQIEDGLSTIVRAVIEETLGIPVEVLGLHVLDSDGRELKGTILRAGFRPT